MLLIQSKRRKGMELVEAKQRITELEQIAKDALTELDAANYETKCGCKHKYCKKCRNNDYLNCVISALKQRF